MEGRLRRKLWCGGTSGGQGGELISTRGGVKTGGGEGKALFRKGFFRRRNRSPKFQIGGGGGMDKRAWWAKAFQERPRAKRKKERRRK